MERYIWFEVVAMGKMDDYKAWFDARNKVFEELGLPVAKMYEVQNRTMNMVCVISPELAPGEYEQWFTKAVADERYQKVQREMYHEKKLMVDGTTEEFRMTSD